MRRSEVAAAAVSLAFFVVRGLLLWVAIPLTVVGWVVLSPARGMRRMVKRTTQPLRQYLYWADDVLSLALLRGLAPLHADTVRSLRAGRSSAWPSPTVQRAKRSFVADLW
jgi:hypothetical protein